MPQTKPKYSAELWIDEEGYTNFKWHIEGGSFTDARKVLVKFIECLQTRLETGERCPFYEREDVNYGS
jgi:hypothetical protein